MPGATFAQLPRHGVALRVFRAEPIHRAVGDADVGNFRHQVADAVAVDGKTEPQLGGNLVALGDGDLPHVVAEAHQPRPLPVMPRVGRAHPRAQPVLHLRIGPVTDNHLAAEPHPRVQEARLAVAMRGLVEVHEIHVDRAPRQVAVELGVEMGKRFLQRGQPADPHF